jgi:uncharacterized protein YciI
MRILCFLFAGLLFAQESSNPPGMECHVRTLVLFVPGPNKDKHKDLMAAHVSYLRQQMGAEKVIAAGPFTSSEGAAIVFASDKWNEVEGILKDDPFTRAGVIRVAEHNTWNACQSVGAHLLPARP